MAPSCDTVYAMQNKEVTKQVRKCLFSNRHVCVSIYTTAANTHSTVPATDCMHHNVGAWRGHLVTCVIKFARFTPKTV
jgi:hypothetical protein